MSTEYVVLKTVHPTFLNLQMPTEVGTVIGYEPREDGSWAPPARGIAFLARGPGVVRVAPTRRVSEYLPFEMAHDRYLATAHLSEKLVFNLPEAVIQYLGLKVQREPKGTRFTDDGLLWFLPAPEYFEFRAQQRSGEPYRGPSLGALAHMYLARSLIPWEGELDRLEREIELEEWSGRPLAAGRAGRTRRAAAPPEVRR